MSDEKNFEPIFVLDEQGKALALKDLNEKDEKQVKADIKYIRDWLLKHDYVKSRTDDEFILQALRQGRFSYSKTQKIIENYWSHRAELREYFYNRDFSPQSVLMEIAENNHGFCLLKPDHHGRIIWVSRPAMWDPKKHDFLDYAKYTTACCDLAWQDPRTHVFGAVGMLDLTNLNTEHYAYATIQRAQMLSKGVEKIFPARVKAVHIFNYPKLFDAFYALAKPFLQDKIKKRIFFHGSNVEGLKSHFPADVLPKEYGGTGESIEVLSEKWISYVKCKEGYIKMLESYGADLDKFKTKKEKSVDREKEKTSTSGVTGTFRKQALVE